MRGVDGECLCSLLMSNGEWWCFLVTTNDCVVNFDVLMDALGGVFRKM